MISFYKSTIYQYSKICLFKFAELLIKNNYHWNTSVKGSSISTDTIRLPQHFLPSLIFHSSSIQKFQMEYNSFHQFALYSQNCSNWVIYEYFRIGENINSMKGSDLSEDARAYCPLHINIIQLVFPICITQNTMNFMYNQSLFHGDMSYHCGLY